MPGEVRPAPAGHLDAPVDERASVSSAHSAMGTRGSTRVVQSTRQYDASLSSPTAVRKMSAPLPRAGPSG